MFPYSRIGVRNLVLKSSFLIWLNLGDNAHGVRNSIFIKNIKYPHFNIFPDSAYLFYTHLQQRAEGTEEAMTVEMIQKMIIRTEDVSQVI